MGSRVLIGYGMRRFRREAGVDDRMDQGVIRWFGYYERMNEERLASRVYELDVRGIRRRGRHRREWMDSAKDVLLARGEYRSE